MQGTIKAAQVQAKGTVFCCGGIEGDDRTLIQAGKNLAARHIKGATVIAGRTIRTRNSIIKSFVSAKRIGTGDQGEIVGGTLQAWEDIHADTIGSDLRVKTELILGDELPRLREDLDHLDGKRNRHLLLLARCYGACGQFPEAVDALKPLLNVSVPAVDVLLVYSEMCRKGGMAEQAVEVIKAFLIRFSRQPQIRAEYGLLLVETGQLEEAQTYLQPFASAAAGA